MASRKPRTVGDAFDRPRGPKERAIVGEARKALAPYAEAREEALHRIAAREAKRLGRPPRDLLGIIAAMHFERLGRRWRDLPATALFEPLTPGRRRGARDEAAFAEVDARMAENKRLTERNATAKVAKTRELKPDAFRRQYREWKKTHR